MVNIIPENIPDELKAIPQWVMWSAENHKGKISKVPYRPKNPNLKASTKNPEHWATFEEALDKLFLFDGIGLVMTGINNLVGIDLDHCVNPETGEIHEWAKNLMDMLDTYWEFSPSGTGLRAFMYGRIPGKPFLNRNQGIEIYDGSSPRYLTVTGQRL